MSFKKDFVWGVATSSYQIEGGAYEKGKGLNIWDIYCKQKGKILNNENGDVACDHYHLFKEDIKIMKQLGVKAYRFSVNWARILPNGIGKINEDGIRFYNELIDNLIENNIEPYLTLYHWELPYELYKKGGFMNDEMVDWFGEYAKVIAMNFSDRVKKYFTFNEPQCFIGLGFLSGIHAPGLKVPIHDSFVMAHNVLKAHGMAVKMLREYAKQDIEIGYAPTCGMAYPDTQKSEDIEATKQFLFMLNSGEGWAWNIPWWSDPIIFGEYPEEGLKKYKNYLPKITKEDMKLISEPIDFYGQNMYNGSRIKMGEDGKPKIVDRYSGFPKTGLNWPITPECMNWSTKFLYERYKKPIYITENGLACHDVISLDGKVHDPNRIDFLQRYLRELKKSTTQADVRGYFQWSLLDNFEWHNGYAERFGLVYVDYNTQQRILKDSAYWYKNVIEQNGENL